MKTSELIGPALDWAVAKAQNLKVVPHVEATVSFPDEKHFRIVQEERWDGRGRSYFVYFSPSTDWNQGGPIIEREFIRVDPVWRTVCPGNYAHGVVRWDATHPRNLGGLIRYHGSGATPLIAAMRCYVASKLGDEVDVPKELT